MIPEMEEHFERITSKGMESINMETYLAVANREFKTLLFQLCHGIKISRSPKNRLKNKTNEISRQMKLRPAKGHHKTETGCIIQRWRANRDTKTRSYLRGESCTMRRV
jgi:hypothetical protein